MECEFEQFSFEMDVVYEIQTYRKDVLALKNYYPELYDMKSEFFDKVLNVKRERALIDEYMKKLMKYKKSVLS